MATVKTFWGKAIANTKTVNGKAIANVKTWDGLSAAAGYDADAQTYINAVITAGGSLTSTQQDGINRWFLDMKGTANGSYSTYNVYARLKLVYLYTQGASAARDCINAVLPGTYTGSDTASPTYNSTNKTVAFNGTTQYTNTNFTPNGSTTFGTSDFTGMFIHRVDTNNDTNATVGEVGGGNSYMQSTGTTKTIILSAQSVYGTNDGIAVNHMRMSHWIDSTHVDYADNGVNKANVNLTFNNTPTRSVLVGAFNAAAVGFGGPSTVDQYGSITGAWSQAEVTMMYDAGKALKVALGGTAWV